jgi:hypothetical protein
MSTYNPNSAIIISIPLNGIPDNANRIMVWDVDANVIQIINTLDNSVYAELGGSFKHYLGEAYLGGVIFNLYKGEDGLEHGQVVSLTENTSSAWSTVANLEGAISSWDGVSNTANMVAITSPAKQYIQTLGAGWYLPSLDELNILFNNRYYANKGLSFIPGGTPLGYDFGTAVYWSSTEYDKDSAVVFYFGQGGCKQLPKNNKLYVRGIKSF